jgi:Fe-S-cluster containining protein
MKKFRCLQCGHCCKNLEGFLPVWEWEAEELKKIADEKNIALKFVPSEIWLDEKTGLTWNFQIRILQESCPFLLNNQCSIYKNRPLVCRSFPLGINEKKTFFGNCPNLETEKTNPDCFEKKFFGKEISDFSIQLNKIKKTINSIMDDLIKQNKIKPKKLNKLDYPKFPAPIPFFEFLVKAKLISENEKENLIKSLKITNSKNL